MDGDDDNMDQDGLDGDSYGNYGNEDEDEDIGVGGDEDDDDN